MQTLLFNTTTKYVKVTEGSTITHEFYNISTVKPREGYYELIEKKRRIGDDLETSRPVARFPISNTNMLIEE
jgi:hypothetical protein